MYIATTSVVYYASFISHQPLELTLTTPTLLFSTISLLMLAYTNRFLALASLIRNLHARLKVEHDNHSLRAQIKSLRLRVRLIRAMQFLAVSSFLFSMVCMVLIFTGHQLIAKFCFIISILLQSASIAISAWEISISMDALRMELSDMETDD